jgi:hypothetical protein
MNTMKMPGFTADRSLYAHVGVYRSKCTNVRSHREILPQIPPGGASTIRKCAKCRPDSNSSTGYSKHCCEDGECQDEPCRPSSPSTGSSVQPPPVYPPASTRTGTYCAETVEEIVGYMQDGTPVFGYRCRIQTFTSFDGLCTGSPFADPARFHTQCVTGADITQCCYGWHEYPWIFASDDGSVKQGCGFCVW